MLAAIVQRPALPQRRRRSEHCEAQRARAHERRRRVGSTALTRRAAAHDPDARAIIARHAVVSTASRRTYDIGGWQGHHQYQSSHSLSLSLDHSFKSKNIGGVT